MKPILKKPDEPGIYWFKLATEVWIFNGGYNGEWKTGDWFIAEVDSSMIWYTTIGCEQYSDFESSHEIVVDFQPVALPV